MAGGANATAVPCLKCAARADRTSEGQEDDQYRCSECGFEFGIDWSYDGPPQTPRWPVSPAEAEEIRRHAARVFNRPDAHTPAEAQGGAPAATRRPAAGGATGYKVSVYENARYMDEGARRAGGEFESAAEAVASAKARVDSDLLSLHQPGMTPEELFRHYTTFGEEPTVAPSDDDSRFSAWDYARERCQTIYGGPRTDESQGRSDSTPRVRLEAEYRDVVRRSMPRPHEAVDYLLRPDYVAQRTDEELRDFIRDFSHLANEEDELKRMMREAVDKVLAGVPAAVQAAIEEVRAREKGVEGDAAPPAKPSDPE